MLRDREMRLHPAAHNAVLIDQKRDTLHPETERPIDPEQLYDVLVLVRQQREGQAVFLAEAFVAFGTLRTDSRHGETCTADFPVDVANRAGLAGAPRGEICRVEVKDRGAILEQSGKGNVMPVLVGEGELRNFGAGVKHGAHIKTRASHLPVCVGHARVTPVPSFPTIPRLPDPPSGRVFKCGAVAQLGERRVRNAKVEGSIPFRSTRKPRYVALY